MNRKKKQKTKRQAPKADKSLSQWEQSVRTMAAISTRPAYPQTPVMPDGQFTAGELGQPDTEGKPDEENPAGVQGGRGPLNEEGEGDRQNDQLAELEADVDAKEDLEERR